MVFGKTVLQIVPSLESGGAERTTVEIAEAIVAAGGRAIVASRGGRLASEIEAVGGELAVLPVHSKNPARILANRGRLIRLIENEKVDIVHVRSRAPAWSALMAARATGKPLIATYHGAYAATGPLKRFYNSAMVRADVVIANSAFTAGSIGAQYRLPAERLRVIPRGADLRIFNPQATTAERIAALARSWAVDQRPGMRLLLPARLTRWKGQDIAIRAVSRLAGKAAGQRRDLTLVLAGDVQGSGFAEALLREIKGRGVEDMVYLVGHCADMPAAYGWADAVLAPSTSPEAFGRVAAEAGAMERPVIGSDIGGQRETIVDGETGFLTPPGDDDALAGAIAQLRAMGEAGRRAMGEKAAARIRANFSADAMRAATLAVYAELAS